MPRKKSVLKENFLSNLSAKLRSEPENQISRSVTPEDSVDSFLDKFMEDLQKYVKEFQANQARMKTPVQKVAMMGIASEITDLNNSLRPIINALRSGDDQTVIKAAKSTAAT
jgi:hypothetical protein